MKKTLFLIITLILIIYMPLYAEFKISGSNGDVILSFEELKDMPKEALIDFKYKIYRNGKFKEVSVKGISLRYLLLERAGISISDGDLVFIKNRAPKIVSVGYKDTISSYAKAVLALEEDGVSLTEDANSYNIYLRSVYSNTDSVVHKDVLGIKLSADVSPYKAARGKAFVDLGNEHLYAESAIYYLYQKGIISGLGGGKFGPYKTVNRAEMSKIGSLSIGAKKVDYKGTFRDVLQSDWFAPYVAQAVENEIFMGYEDGSFKPYNSISRQEFAMVLVRLAQNKGLIKDKEFDKMKSATLPYRDSFKISKYAKPYVVWLEQKGAFEGLIGDSFQPDKAINRAEACRALYVVLFK